jgi:competence protein CoiA
LSIGVALLFCQGMGYCQILHYVYDFFQLSNTRNMQLYGLDTNNLPIYAPHAKKRTDYQCPECRGIIRLREGEIREAHFYHLNPPSSCRQSGKSLTHLNIQHQIAAKLPEGECVLEFRFPEINRIADLYWEKERLVFEIQCSPMSKEEMLERTRNYRSIGCEIVWILHERNYNRYRMSALERAIAPIPHYFSDMTPGGDGILYDQWFLAKNGFRIKALPKLEIQIGLPIRKIDDASIASPFLKFRNRSWPLCFPGDLLDLAKTDPDADYIKRAVAMDIYFTPPKESFWKRLLASYEAWLNRKLRTFCE